MTAASTNALKGGLQRLAHRLGYKVARREDPYRLDLYRSLYDAAVLDRKPFYNVGAGSFSHPLWVNIDFESDWYAAQQKGVVHHDLMSLKPLPIDSGTAEIVYTSHTIEHVSYAAVEVLFRECFRCLREGGLLRVTTGPDAETDFRALQAGDADWFYWDGWYDAPGSYEQTYHAPATSVPLEERWLHHVASQLAPNSRSPSPIKVDAVAVRSLIDTHGFPDVLDVLTAHCRFDPERPGNHISWWTHDRLIELLRRCGFGQVYRSGCGQSASPLMRRSELFDSTHPQMSIYVEARKTAGDSP